jgi:hypothetical protein
MPDIGRIARLVILASAAGGSLLLLWAVFVAPNSMISASQVPDPATRLELQNQVRTTLVQGLGAAFLVAGAYFTWWQIQLNRQHLRQTLESSTAQLRLSREGQLTEQFSRALEHLGHDKVGVRAGAMYALERIAKTSAEMRPAIHQLLADYVRTESTWPYQDPVTFAAIEPEAETGRPSGAERLLRLRAPEIQAAMAVIGRRTPVPDEVLELQDVDLRCGYLHGADLRFVIMGRAMLAEATFEEADLSYAHLRRSNLRSAILTRATLRGTELQEAILCGADLSGATLLDADLRDAICDESTVWPEGFDWQSAGVKRQVNRRLAGS